MQTSYRDQSRHSPTDLITTARHLGITLISGQLGPPEHGRMWIDGRGLDEILCPKQAERQVMMLIAPGGTGEAQIKIGHRTLDKEGLRRMAAAASASGGIISEGWLAVLTPASWLKRHGSEETTFDAAVEADWPINCGDNPALFLGDHSIFSLLAQANVGRTVTMLVATSAA